MKKIILTLLFIFMFTLVLSPVLAIERENKVENSKDNIQNIKERIQTILQRKPENVNSSATGLVRKPDNISSKASDLANKNAENKKRVRTSINARWNAYENLASRSGQLLDKLQIRIDKAKTAGNNTTDAERTMTDARAKLADARDKLDLLKSLISTDLDKNGFKDAQKGFQAVHKDLNIVKQDASKIIRNLKSFNSEKDSTKSAEIRSSSSATKSASERD